jgi:hypothetical protein
MEEMNGMTPARLWNLWRWGGAILSALLVAILLSTLRGGRPGQLPGANVPPSPPTYLGPTATPLGQTVDAGAAWGPSFPTATLTLDLPVGAHFIAEDVIPDASGVIGDYTVGGAQSVAIATLAQPRPRILYTFPTDMIPPQVCTDGRYVGWAGGEVGEAAPSAHQIVGYVDLQTGRVTRVLSVYDYSLFGPCLIDNGLLIWDRATANTSLRINMTDMAHGRTTPLPYTGFSLAWQWPNLLFNESAPDGSQALHVFNSATKNDASVLAVGPLGPVPPSATCAFAAASILCLALTDRGNRLGDVYTLFVLVSPDASPQPEAQFVTYATPQLVANPRLVVVSVSGPGGFINAWDTVQQRFVALSAGGVNAFALLRGDALALTILNDPHITLVNTIALAL